MGSVESGVAENGEIERSERIIARFRTKVHWFCLDRDISPSIYYILLSISSTTSWVLAVPPISGDRNFPSSRFPSTAV